MPVKTSAAKKSKTLTHEETEQLFKSFPTYESWKKIGFSPRFGVLIQLASLRTERNWGIGDFSDIIAFMELSKEIGSTIIQLLPINDMGRGKVPYSSLSAFALDPVYIAIDEIPEYTQDTPEEIHAYMRENWHIIEEQRDSDVINVDAIRNLKFDVLYRLFWAFLERNRQWNTDRWRSFVSFCRNHKYWLDDYAVFRTLKNKLDWSPWQEWPESLRDHFSDTIEEFKRENEDEVLFAKFIQWVAYGQMSRAHNICRANGVLLKGDIPLQVDFESADVWAHPQYFNLDLCAGAPPDQYSPMGQNWGSPTYNWDKLGLDNYIWWRKRLEYTSAFYDIYRIDHVVGLFRIWSNPITPEFPRGRPTGNNGYFDPEDPGEGNHKPIWENHGKTLLKMMIESCEMLPIGEDLGTIPYACRYVMSNMGIPGYKVLIWERSWGENNAPFFEPEDYGYISMATTTTHDFWSLAGYWLHPEQDEGAAYGHRKNIEELWRFIMGDKEFDFSEYSDEFHYELLDRLFNSGSIFLILPFNDLWGTIPGMYADDPQYDRINDPSNPERELNWATKMPMTIEEFFNNKDTKKKIAKLNKMAVKSNRFQL